MGVVIKQSVRSSIISYLGVGVGFVNTILLFPKMLSLEEIGLFKLLLSFCIILMPILQFNGAAGFTKFYPFYSQKSKEFNGLISFFFLLSLTGFSCFGLGVLFWKESIFNWLFAEKAPLVLDYSWTLLPLVFFFLYSNLLETIIFSKLKSVFSTFLKTVVIRVLTTCIVVLYYFDWINQFELITLFVSIYGLQFVLLGFYFVKLFSFKLVHPKIIFTSEHFKAIKSYLILIFLGGSGAALVPQIDSLMSSSKLGLEYTGIYTIAFYIAVIIEIPRRSIIQIVAPLLSQAIEKKDERKVVEIYRKTAINQFIASGLVFLLLVVSLEDIYNFIPSKDNYALIIQGMPVVFIIGFSYVIDMLMGCNTEIIHYSKLYKWNAVLIPLLAVMSIGLNLLYLRLLSDSLIAIALATFTTIVTHNFIRSFIIYKHFKIWPFGTGHLKFTAILVLSTAIAYLLPDVQNKYLSILINSSVVTAITVGGAFILNVSEDFTQLCNTTLNKTMTFFKGGAE